MYFHKSMAARYHPLLNEGYEVIPYPPRIRDELDINKFLREQKEFVNVNENQKFVLGAFGALGNPSSFHHPSIRKLRHDIQGHAREYFRGVFPGKYMQMLPDRFSIREPNTTIGGESWHRDLSYHADNIYGGWMNLDDTPQYFSGIPTTHLSLPDDADMTGFTTFTKEEQKELNNYRTDRIVIPPRHMLIFNERLIHEVPRMDIKNRSYRFYTKFAITDNQDMLVPDLDNLLTEQAVLPLSSSQTPSMFAKLHKVNHQQKLNDFSQTIKPEFRDANGRVFEHLPSLESRNMLFEPYTNSERETFKPTFL